MRKNINATLHSEWYRLEPGDATSYLFFLVNLGQGYPSGLFTGVNSLYVGVGIVMPSGCGYYEVPKDALAPLRAHTVHYYQGHTGVYLYTCAAVLLAASVLVNDPDDLEGACKAMLQVPTLLESDLPSPNLEEHGVKVS